MARHDRRHHSPGVNLLTRREGRLYRAVAGALVLFLLMSIEARGEAQQPLPPPPVMESEPVYPAPAPGAELPQPPTGPAGAFTLVTSEHFAFFVQSDPDMSASETISGIAPPLEVAYTELSALFAIDLTAPFVIYVYERDEDFQEATGDLEPGTPASAAVQPDPLAARLHVSLPRLGGLSPLEVENALRHGAARVLLSIASGGNLPRGLAEGMAMYVERPIVPRLARYAAVTSGAYQNGVLLSWSDLNRRSPVAADADLVTSESYAMVAFLVDRYGFRSFQGMLAELRQNPDWRLAMRSSYNRGANEIEAQWRDNLPRWAASEWRGNLVAAFDLAPGRSSLDAGNYAGAKELLEHSWRLYTDLEDDQRLAETESLLNQANTGIQAETAMTQAQQALELHAYDRARALLTQARAQYDQLPADHRPESMLETYESLAESGLAATASLAEARQRKSSWNDYRQARASALDAGTRFAALGDAEMQGEASAILDELDDRQRRLVLLLGTLGAITAAWLVLWLWTRGPSIFKWR